MSAPQPRPGREPVPVPSAPERPRVLVEDEMDAVLRRLDADGGPADEDLSGDGVDGGWTDSLVRELKRSMPPGALLGLKVFADGDVLELQLLRVSIGHRGQGHATRVLTRVCAEADARDLTVVCTPTDEFGADRTRLENIARRHGFTPVAPGTRRTGHTWERPAHPRSTTREEQ
ncbi:GNAT family N-acetyltransferase [Streptomyces sp. NPDC057638]|uniref:GNAT family N-acetyltransferase n=1 Tax=Streptomyces sp. NPDC057638 TaxID=3346190 RepID=UPI0036C3C97F